MARQMTLEFDTPEWRQVRDHKLREWVQDENALAWFLDFAQVCEVIDDLIDRDKAVPDTDISGLLFSTLIEMPLNAFFNAHKSVLCGIIVTGINSWLDANQLQRAEYPEGTKYAEMDDLIKAFSLRDQYMEVLAAIIYITRGQAVMRELSPQIRAFFQSESFIDYVRKLRESKHPVHGELPVMEAAE